MVKFLLAPFALLYSLGVIIRGYLYDSDIFKRTAYNFPLIGIGNLRVGGTGKTPMVEYLVGLLQSDRKVGVLSRGYGRKTQGFILGNEASNPEAIGDEPHQILRRFPNISVAVDEVRTRGVERLKQLKNPPNVILLDDAFQHRKINPGLMIMLSAYDKLYLDDCPLPVGRLREPKFSAKRADIIVVTKCPETLSLESRKELKRRVNPREYQKIYFAIEKYNGLKLIGSKETSIEIAALKDYSVVLVTGLADASNLLSWVKKVSSNVIHIEFGDHHWFTEEDLMRVKTSFEEITDKRKLILTTEKDAQRVEKWLQNEKFAALSIYALQHEMAFFKEDKLPFESKIYDFINSY